jgi:hypothetical protein
MVVETSTTKTRSSWRFLSRVGSSQAASGRRRRGHHGAAHDDAGAGSAVAVRADVGGGGGRLFDGVVGAGAHGELDEAVVDGFLFDDVFDDLLDDLLLLDGPADDAVDDTDGDGVVVGVVEDGTDAALAEAAEALLCEPGASSPRSPRNPTVCLLSTTLSTTPPSTPPRTPMSPYSEFSSRTSDAERMLVSSAMSCRRGACGPAAGPRGGHGDRRRGASIVSPGTTSSAIGSARGGAGGGRMRRSRVGSGGSTVAANMARTSGVLGRIGLALDLEGVDGLLAADEQDHAGDETGAEGQLTCELADVDEGGEGQALEGLAAQLEGDLRVVGEAQLGALARGQGGGLAGLTAGAPSRWTVPVSPGTCRRRSPCTRGTLAPRPGTTSVHAGSSPSSRGSPSRTLRSPTLRPRNSRLMPHPWAGGGGFCHGGGERSAGPRDSPGAHRSVWAG